MNKNIIAIVPAAGLGKRLGPGTNKPFQMLLDKPLIIWTLEILESSPEIKEIIPVLKEQDMATGTELFDSYNLSKIRRIVQGGAERQDSVYNGLRQLDAKADIVLIHDGARPFVSRDIIRNSINSLKGFDGVVVGVPVKDTIKKAEDGVIRKTLPRNPLWAIQTPQVFFYEPLMRAYNKAMEDNFYSTDDSALVERLGGRIKIIMGSYENMKITTPEDIVIAEHLLKGRLQDKVLLARK